MIAIHDPELPGLSGLDAAALQRITGAEDVSLMRFRYRAGKRAILHLETEAGEGSVWFFQGDKARRLARRNKPTARYDRASEALYETFPNDHRMPQIRAFLDDYARVARELIGGRPAGAPDLLRYRPGLSCTFRCRRADGVAVYVKLINDDSPARLAEMNRQMVAHLAASSVSVAPVIGIAPERAAECVDMTRLTVPAMTDAVARVFARLEADPPRLAMRPIHADVKLEHLFIDAGQTTLIDTESVSLGPPDYDLAQLFGRLWQAELEGQLPRGMVDRAASAVREAAGGTFDWCLDVVALRLAKFYAQRPTPDAAGKIAAILERLS